MRWIFREPLLKGRLSTIDLPVLTSLDQLFFNENVIYLFYKTGYLNEEVKCTSVLSLPLQLVFLG